MRAHLIATWSCLLFAGSLAACFSPTYGEVPFACENSEKCPAGYHCVERKCRRVDTLIDAAPSGCELGSCKTDWSTPVPDSAPRDTRPPLPAGLVAYYPFEGNAKDALGAHDGKLHPSPGGPSFVADGKLGQALLLDSVDDYVELPPLVKDSFTIVFWVKTTMTTAGTATDDWWVGSGIVDGEMCEVQNDFGVSLIGSQAVFGIGAQGGTDLSIRSQVSINNGAWHHVAAVRDKTTGVLQLYVDGGSPATNGGGTHTLDAPIWLGVGNGPCNVSTNQRWFGGQVDELLFFSRPLSSDEIHSLYAGQ